MKRYRIYWDGQCESPVKVVDNANNYVIKEFMPVRGISRAWKQATAFITELEG